MKVTVKSPVWEDLRHIGEEIAKNNPQAALRFFDAARNAFRLLGHHPGIGHLRSFSQPGVRSSSVPGFRNYLIFYLPRSEEVQILAVIHGARDFNATVEERL